VVADDALDPPSLKLRRAGFADDAEVVGRPVQREQVRKVCLAEEPSFAGASEGRLEVAVRPAATHAIGGSPPMSCPASKSAE